MELQAQGLVAGWLLDDGSGFRARDFVGARHGTLVGFEDPATVTSGWTPGVYGSALQFLATDYIDLGSNTYDLGIRRHATFATHISWRDFSTTRSLGGDWNDSLGWSIRIDNATTMVFFIYPNNHRITATVPTLVANQVYHVVGVMNGATMHLYLDGRQVGQAALNEDIGDSAETVKLGQRGDGTSYLNGSIEDFLIYTRALNAQEVHKLATAPFGWIGFDYWAWLSSVAAPAGNPWYYYAQQAALTQH